MKPIEKIYLAFYKSKSQRLYFNELKEISGLGDSSLSKNLNDLLKKNEIIKEKEKSNTFYTLKNIELKSIYFTKFSVEKFNNLNFKVNIPLKSFIDKISNINSIIHFGSSSRGEEKKGSDIDLLIILNSFKNKKLQKIYNQEIKKEIEEIKNQINSKSIYPISCFYIIEEDFKLEENDNLIISAKNTGYPIYNQMEFYKKNAN